MKALSGGLRWLGALLLGAAEAMERAVPEPWPIDPATAAAAEEALRELRSRYY